ncbi:MAG: hemolysin III family protein [Bacteroidales bacterium]|nr:hemolysin III family protein [Bacteroidales bacterium]
MNRTPLKERPFPDYTRKEELLNMWSHIFGAVCAVVMMWIVVRLTWGNPLAMISCVVYVTTVLVMLVVSAVYHGLPKGMPKQVMRVVDHCDIFFTIAGTYTPITLLGICPINPVMGWTIFAIEWVLAIVGATLNAIDLKRFSKFSMACYLGMGWCVVISLKPALQALTWPGFLLVLAGGVAYTIGAVLYQIGKKKRYRHFVFHIFVVIAVVVQFIGFVKYLI